MNTRHHFFSPWSGDRLSRWPFRRLFVMFAVTAWLVVANAEQAMDRLSPGGLRVERPPGMELTFGSDATPSQAATYAALGVTSVESYVDWAGVEPEENQWDWSKWDQQVAILKEAKLKWVPFLICGTAYGTPLWFQNGPDSHYFRCLEHEQDSRVQSLFNPALRPRIERFIQAFAARYRDSGVIESVLLGFSGVYGESLYPAGPVGGWTAKLTGDYHNHGGWWAADRYAVAAFRQAMRAKYGTIAALNAAWQTQHASFDEVTPFLPERAPDLRARADFAEWYQQAMTEWSVFWATTTRRAFPQTEIYLCTGGNGTPSLGADFTAQTKAMSALNVGIRITNEGSDYAANFVKTREVATATRLYGTFCGFEPAGKVDAQGVVARIYNATASGARQLHYYKNNVLGNAEAEQNFRAEIQNLKPRHPVVSTALYFSRETWALDPAAIKRLSNLAEPLRDLMDLDFVTRLSVTDRALTNLQALILAESPVLEPGAAAAIERFVRDGGVLIATTRPDEVIGQELYDLSAWRKALFAPAADGVRLQSAPQPARLAALTRRVGKGWTVYLPGLAGNPDELLKTLAALLRNPPDYLSGVRPLAPDDGRLDGIYTTTFKEGVLRYDAKAATIR